MADTVATWDAEPSKALWYGEVIGSMPGKDIDYLYGYSASVDQPDELELAPDGWEIEEHKCLPTPANPSWEPSESED